MIFHQSHRGVASVDAADGSATLRALTAEQDSRMPSRYAPALVHSASNAVHPSFT